MTRREQRINIMICLYQYLLIGNDINEIVKDVYAKEFDDINEFSKEIIDFALACQDELIKITNSRLEDYTFERLGYVEQAIVLSSLSEIALANIDRAIIINEAVEIAKIYCDDIAFKLINGILDK